MQNEWNSLEIAKLIASLMTPSLLAILGIYVHRITKKFEHRQWRSQKLIEKRLSIYDDIAPILNDIMCYYCYIGQWRDIDPPEIVRLKRVIDKKIALARPLFSNDFSESCSRFMGACFETYNDWGKDAKIRSLYGRRKQFHPRWNEQWEECFSDTNDRPETVKDAYEKIMKAFSREIGVTEEAYNEMDNFIPSNIK